MISVAEAKELIQKHCTPLSAKQILLKDAHEGYALAEDVFSAIDFPTFKQSAMDGYAIRLEDLSLSNTLIVQGVMQAGEGSSMILESGKAIRIFTGAPMPEGADTVIMQEHILLEGDQIKIMRPDIILGANIRAVGSQTQAGDLVLKKGSALNAGAMALLASVGIWELMVFNKPFISIINTGKELIQPNERMQMGSVYESNSYSLMSALTQMQISYRLFQQVDDDLQTTIQVIQEALTFSDILLITGGVSVGDYDFVVRAAEANGIEKIFHKVKQKPGKPLYFGKKENKLIFGLPGNPGSVLTCFYMYVFTALRRKMGFEHASLLNVLFPMSYTYEKKSGLTHFLKADLKKSGLQILDHQESYKMNAFALTNALVEIPEEVTEIQKGDLVNVYLLPY